MLKPRGFTLLELLIVISIAAILLTLAVPSFRSVMLTSERGEASTSLYGGLVRAHSEAIIRNATITICPRLSSTGSGNFPLCDTSSGSWTHGWIVYQDSQPNLTSAKPYAAADIIAVGDPTDTAFAIATVPAGTNSLQFASSGRTVFANSGKLTMTLCKVGDGTYEGRVITVEYNGHVSLTTFTPTGSSLCPSS
jgi:type IV fimbrial biogenesis protein FimT